MASRDPDGSGNLRAKPEIEHALETARLWHWRTRTEALRAADALELPTSWDSLEQLVAVAAMRGYERGLLPSPLRGDFPAFGTGYRDLSPAQRAEVVSIAYERHRALEWLVRRRSRLGRDAHRHLRSSAPGTGRARLERGAA